MDAILTTLGRAFAIKDIRIGDIYAILFGQQCLNSEGRVSESGRIRLGPFLAPPRLLGRFELVEFSKVEPGSWRGGLVDDVGEARAPDNVRGFVRIAGIDGLRKDFIDAGNRHREAGAGFEQ